MLLGQTCPFFPPCPPGLATKRRLAGGCGPPWTHPAPAPKEQFTFQSRSKILIKIRWTHSDNTLPLLSGAWRLGFLPCALPGQNVGKSYADYHPQLQGQILGRFRGVLKDFSFLQYFPLLQFIYE